MIARAVGPFVGALKMRLARGGSVAAQMPGFFAALRMTVEKGADRLVLDEVHDPAGGDSAADEEGETEGSEADHHARFGALGNAEDDGREQRKEDDGGEVGEGHERFLPLARECASTAATTFSR